MCLLLKCDLALLCAFTNVFIYVKFYLDRHYFSVALTVLGVGCRCCNIGMKQRQHRWLVAVGCSMWVNGGTLWWSDASLESVNWLVQWRSICRVTERCRLMSWQRWRLNYWGNTDDLTPTRWRRLSLRNSSKNNEEMFHAVSSDRRSLLRPTKNLFLCVLHPYSTTVSVSPWDLNCRVELMAVYLTNRRNYTYAWNY